MLFLLTLASVPIGQMINEMPLELLIHILSQLNVSDLIKLRAVCKKWRLVIDRYLLLELNMFDDCHTGNDFFSRQMHVYSNPKNKIKCGDAYRKKRIWKWTDVNLYKIGFLFRNARKLFIFESTYNPTPMTGFVGE